MSGKTQSTSSQPGRNGGYSKYLSLGYLKGAWYFGVITYLIWDRWTRPKNGKSKKQREKEKQRETFVDASLRSAEERMGIIEYRLRQIEENQEHDHEPEYPEPEQEERLPRSASETIRESGRRVRAQDRLREWDRRQNRGRSQQNNQDNQNNLHNSLLKLYAHPSLRR